MKKNIVIGILLMLVIGLAGYLGYDKFLKKEASTKAPKEMVEESSSEESNATETTIINQNNDCHQIIIGSTYIAKERGNNGSNGGPVTGDKTMSFKENTVSQEAGTAAWEDNYSVDGSVITFENSGIKSYGIISQDCNTIYITNAQAEPAISVYQKK